MGLAASQARFLAITARKMNCEFQSMQIAQQKLSVTRDLQKAAQDYQTDLSATKLVWESADGDTYDLTYDIMMTPSAINQYDPYLIIDTQGKLVLTKQVYNAAVEAGAIAADGTPSGNPTKNGRDKFLEALGKAGLVDGSTIQAIIGTKNADGVYEGGLDDAGYTKSGIGGEIYDKSTANALTTTAFINYMKTATWADYNSVNNTSEHSDDELMYSIKLTDVLKISDGTSANTNGSTDSDTTLYHYASSTDLNDKNGSDTYSNQFVVTKNGTAVSDTQMESLTLGDILSGKYELSYKGTDAINVVKAVLKAMAETLGYGETGVGLNVDEESDSALTLALEFTNSQLNSYDTEKSNNSKVTELAKYSEEINQIVQGKDDKYSVSLTNLLKSFLTNFAICLDGYDSAFSIDEESAKKSNYVTDDLNYYFLLQNDGAQTDQTMLIADFYNMLYNQLCTQGASNDTTKQELVTDSSYLENALKNGQLFISSLNNDGYFYQGAYTLNGHVAEVSDENAIAQAEAQYTVTKSKLNAKEESLELQMKNLDTEISALTTEFDTVKNLISKNVEKVFTMFSS